MFRGRRSTAAPTRDSQNEKTLRGGGWGSNSLSFSHAQSRNSHFTGGYARRFFAAIAATLLVIGVVAGVGVTAASAATPLSVTTTGNLPPATLNTAYSATLVAAGGTGTDTWSVASGSTLPSWLSLNATTGVLSGTPTAIATATFKVTVTDSASPADTATSSQLTLYVVGANGTQPFTLSSAGTPGQSTYTVGASHQPGATLPDPITIAGQEDPLNGAISSASLSIQPYTSTDSQGSTHVTFSEINPGTATGLVNGSTGIVTINDSLRVTLNLINPVQATCADSPINVSLTGTYNATTQQVTLSDTTFAIPPNFSDSTAPNCDLALGGLVQGALNGSEYAGTTGNAFILAMSGPLTIPVPAAPTTTALTVSPASPQLNVNGTSVTLNATVSANGTTATHATGTVAFQNNGATIGTEPVANGTASYTATNLPTATNQLTAVYSGDTNYALSTSTAVPYMLQPIPTITTTGLPATATPGQTVPFTVTITNPAGGENYPNVWANIGAPFQSRYFYNGVANIDAQDSAGTWCPLPNPNNNADGGNDHGNAVYFGWNYSGPLSAPCGTPPSSFSLPAGTTITIPLEVSFSASAMVSTVSLYERVVHRYVQHRCH